MLFIGDYIHSKADARAHMTKPQSSRLKDASIQVPSPPPLDPSTPDCFSILWTAAGCLIVIVCGNLTSTFCLCLSFRVSARVWLIFLPLFAQLSSKQLPPPPPPPLPLPLPASCLLWLYPHEFVCRKNFGCSCQDSPSIFLITRVM